MPLQGGIEARRDVGAVCMRLVRYAANQEMAAHSHDWLSVTIVLAGSLRDHAQGKTFACGPLMLLVKPAGTAHGTAIGPNGALTVHFAVPASLAHEVADVIDVHACHYLRAGPATAALLGLSTSGALSTAECSARITRTIGQRCGAGLTAAAARAAATIYDAPLLSTRAAAHAAAMHPVAYARRIRRLTGMSPSQLRQHARVRRAAAALADSRDAAIEVAHAAGFADQAHLCRTFKRETALTPGQFRALIAAITHWPGRPR